jgi:hypothetical protein
MRWFTTRGHQATEGRVVQYALMQQCVLAWETLRTWLLRHFCYRTGKRGRDAATPLYRLRCALSRLWLAHPQRKLPILSQSSG